MYISYKINAVVDLINQTGGDNYNIFFYFLNNKQINLKMLFTVKCNFQIDHQIEAYTLLQFLKYIDLCKIHQFSLYALLF